MDNIVQNIELDLWKDRIVTIPIKQKDNRFKNIRVLIVNNGVQLVIPKNNFVTVDVEILKPDGHSVINPCTINTDGTVLFEIDEQISAIDGVCVGWLKIHDLTDPNSPKRMSTGCFNLKVGRDPINDAEVESSYEFDTLQKLIDDAKELQISWNTLQNSLQSVKTSETNAHTSELNASTYANNSSVSASISKSYAVGGTDTRENENIDNAKYYAEQAERIAEGLEGTLIPMGTISFSDLQNTSIAGYMYNIKDEFTTTDRFKEGAGNVIPAGTNVYYTADGFWDCMAGSPVTGIKGNAESSYRRGNVNITPENIGLGNVQNDVQELESEVADLKAFVGYTDDDIYGVEVDFVNKKFTRLAGAVNRSAGSGFDGINAFGGRKRCNVDNSGNVIAYYGDAGFSTTGKLTQAVVVGEGDAAVTYNAGTIAQVMVEQPKFYYKVVPLKIEKAAKGGITRKVAYYVSDTPKAGFKVHPAFIVNGQENEKIYVAAFEGSLWDVSAAAYILDDSQVADFAADMLSSIANAKPISGLTQNLTRAKTRLLAEKRGTGWEQATVQTACASELLMLIEYASFNMQSAIGQGAVNKTDDGTNNMAENTGATITIGNASGAVTNSNGIQIVSYRGEENFWGNIWGWVDGINHYANSTTGECETFIADHGFADDKGTTPYVNAGISAKHGNGYVSAFCYAEEYDWLFIAGEMNGNTALPVGDYFWNQNGTGWRVAVLGAMWINGLSAGAFCWFLSSVSSLRSRYVGGRLVYRKKIAAAV